MAQYDVIILNETVVPPQLQEIQVGDTYRLGADTEIVGNLTVSGTVNGADVAATAALAASATQPGDNLSTLVNDILASQAEAEAGSNNTKIMTPLRVAQAIAILAAGIKNNYGDALAPTTTDDDTEGYVPGSYWIHTGVSPHEVYRCVNNTTNLAVWIKTTLSTDELATVAVSGDSDDLIEGSVNLLLTVAERGKLAAIESAATADQTGAEIKALYEAEANTNAFTDGYKAALDELSGLTLGITAFAGGGQASATLLTTRYNVVDTVASVGDSVKLPVTTGGKILIIKNNGTNSMDLFPQSGVSINKLTADVALAIPADSTVWIYSTSATQWHSL